MISPVGIKYSNYCRPNFQGALNHSNQSDKKPEHEKEGLQKYLTSQNIMLGLGAIGLVTLGIIGHKNGWFSRAVKNASDIADSSKNPKAQPNSHGGGKPLSRDISYQKDGTTPKVVFDYDPKTGNSIKDTYYRKDGKTIEKIIDYDPNTGNKSKYTSYWEDGTSP